MISIPHLQTCLTSARQRCRKGFRLFWQVPDSSEDNITLVLCVPDASEEFSPDKSGDMGGSKVAFFWIFIQFY